MPNTQSQEKIDLLKMLGADVRPVPAVAYTDPANYNHQAKRFAESILNAVWTNQFDNVSKKMDKFLFFNVFFPFYFLLNLEILEFIVNLKPKKFISFQTANKQGHYESTGPEIWEQTKGQVDGFTCSTGTGGTLAGVAEYLKEKSKGRVKIFLADPPGSCLYNYKKLRTLDRIGSSITEGIGQGRITDNLKDVIDTLVDDALYIPDEKTIAMLYRLLDEEGLFIGASSSLNVVAAVEMAKILGPGKTIVTAICDGASRYQTRLFSRSWLESKKLYEAIPSHLRKYASLP